MSEPNSEARLSRIQTAWSLVFEAHKGDGPDRAAQQLLLRYRGAIHRYLLGTLRDLDAADELAQDFALHFLQGRLRRADPQRGRFRDLVKTTLRHLVIDHWRRQGKAPLLASGPLDIAVEGGPGDELDRAFVEQWREELLARTWEALEASEAESGQPYHTVLRWKTEAPQSHSAELASRLSSRLGRPVTENALRKALHRARALFAELLVREVERSLGQARPEGLEQELIELRLLDYCRSALRRRGPQAPGE